MKQKSTKRVFLRLILLLVTFSNYVCNGQYAQIEFSQQQISFEQLEDSIWDKYPDFESALPFARLYLDRAKLQNDSLKIARGYNFLARLNNPKTNIRYADSVILYSKNLDHKNYPTLGYSLKGYWNYQIGNYQEATDAYLVAYKLSLEKSNITQQIEIGNALATLKNSWGNHTEALEIFKNQLLTIKKQADYKINFKEDYIYNLYNTALSYQLNKKYDSAEIYIKNGMKESLDLKDSISYYDFVFTSGINLYFQKNYTKAKDSLEKSKPYIDEYRIPIYHYHLAEIFRELGDEGKFEENLKLSDSLQEITGSLFPELRAVHNHLIDIYKSRADLKNQLKYTTKLLKTDSLLNSNDNYISTEIIKNYDIPRLKSERARLLKKLNDNEASHSLKIYIIVVTSFLLLLVASYQIYVNYRYRKRFELLIHSKSSDKTNQVKIDSKVSPLKPSKLDVSQELIDKIILNLQKFEASKGFTNKELKLTTLAEMFETNSSYLSKTINAKKGKNFSNYLKDLRITYAIDLLKSDNKIRNYTIAAIAEEVGFKSPESFSKAFFLKTGVYPSYFIKKLNKLKK